MFLLALYVLWGSSGLYSRAFIFLLYINDIVNASTALQLILFADDTNVFLSGKDPEYLVNQLNIELNKLSVWFRVNKLSLNLKKTKFIVFKPNQKRRNFVKINNKLIKLKKQFSWV